MEQKLGFVDSGFVKKHVMNLLQIDKETLTLVCTQLRDFIANPFTTPAPPTSTYAYAQCCDAPYVEDPR